MQHLDEGLLQAWLDHPRSGLEPSEVAEIESHLASCEACARELAALRGDSREAHALLAGGLDRTAPRPPFEDVVSRARGYDEVRRARRRLNWLAWAASLVVALGVGWWSNDLYRQARVYEAEQAPATLPDASRDAPAAGEREAIESQVGASTAPDRAEEAARRPAAEPSPEPTAEPTVATNEVAGAGVSAPAAPAGIAADAAAPAPAEALQRQAAALADSDDAIVVTGVVRDEQGGAPVSSAQVYVEALNVGVLTQQDGSYRLVVPTGDSIELTVERIGYRTEKQGLDGRPGEPVVADFQLREEALQLQEVVVTGVPANTQRRALGNAVGRLDAAAVEWSTATSGVAEALLERPLATVPGARVISLEVADSLVRVRQDLGDAVVLTLVQGRAIQGTGQWPIESAGTVASLQVGELLVTATAPLTEDSLRALLQAVR
jgi:hypothetical protein